MLSKLCSTLFILLFSTGITLGQKNLEDFMFPIKPGQQNGLSGTVGELRSTHFHTGLDIKTDGVEGLPVYASYDGYISRIYVSPVGYGHALYIKHPNGYTTVYGHLQRFGDKIAEYVLNEQYKRKSFDLNRFPPKEMFPVKKGDIIAYSGNSGSSGGPHLHWDVRDGAGRPLSSLKAHFPEITDNVKPVIYQIALRTLNKDARINGRFGRFTYKVYLKGDTYYVNEKLSLKGNIGLEILGYDKLNGYPNLCGIYSFEMKHNGVLRYKSAIDRLDFGNQRSIYAYYNYPEKMASGNRFHKIYIDEGNDLDFYKDRNLNGVIKATGIDQINVTFNDPYGNTRVLEINGVSELPSTQIVERVPQLIIDENTLLYKTIKAQNTDALPLHVFRNGEKLELTPYFIYKTQIEYVYDLREGLPDSLVYAGEKTELHFAETIPPKRNYTYYSDEMDLTFTHKDLFDTLYLETDYGVKDSVEYFRVGHPDIPLFSPITITLKPKLQYGEKWSVYAVDENGALYYYGGNWKYGKVSFNTGYFGTFTFAKDETAPKIRPIRVNKSSLDFIITDNLSGIKTFNLTIDGKWILMKYDPKNNRITSEFPTGVETMTGDVVLKVTDQEGNTETYNTKI